MNEPFLFTADLYGSPHVRIVFRHNLVKDFEALVRAPLVEPEISDWGGSPTWLVYASGGKPRQPFVRFCKHAHFGTLRHGFGIGAGLGGMLTFMLTCGTCACYVTSWVWGVFGWGGWGMITFMLTCGTCACYVTSWVWGWGRVGGGC